MDRDEVTLRQARLATAVADLADLPWAELPTDLVDSVLVSLESAHRIQQCIGGDAINRLRTDYPSRTTRRVRDHLTALLQLSATDAGNRIATAVDLASDTPTLPEAAAAARHDLLGPEHIRIIRDTLAKLPDTATPADRTRLDLELTGAAIGEEPETLRRDAALFIADYDATHDEPVTRERSRQARREFVYGPQDADGMTRGRFCLDPEGLSYLEILLAKLARPGMCNATDPLPTGDGDPDPVAAATDTRTTGQRNHDAVKAVMRAILASGDLGSTVACPSPPSSP